MNSDSGWGAHVLVRGMCRFTSSRRGGGVGCGCWFGGVVGGARMVFQSCCYSGAGSTDLSSRRLCGSASVAVAGVGVVWLLLRTGWCVLCVPGGAHARLRGTWRSSVRRSCLFGVVVVEVCLLGVVSINWSSVRRHRQHCACRVLRARSGHVCSE